MVTAWLLPLVAFLAVASTGWATAIVGRQLSAPTARFLFAVVLVLFVTALAQFLVVGPAPVRGAVTALTGVQSPESYWPHLAFGCILLAAGFWFLFAVQYTGRGERLTRQVAAAVVALWVVFYANALWVSLGSVTGATVSLVATLGGGLFFMAALATIGVLLVWETTLGRNSVPSSEGAILSAGALCAVYSPGVAVNLGQPIVLSVLLIAASLAVVVAVVRYPVFSTLPVTRIAARDSLVEELEDAVLIVDRLGRIRDLNPAAATVFDLDEKEAYGRSLEDLLTASIDPDAIADAAEPYRLRTGRDTLSVTGQRVTDDRGRWVGHLLVCRDVTERQRRERRLQVLTRLLAGTIREPATSIARRADGIAADSGSDPHGGGTEVDRAPTVTREESSSVGREIQEIAAVLKDLVARTRDVERAIASHETGPTDVASIVSSLAGERNDRPIEVESPLPKAATAAVDGELLEAVLDLLFEEAAARCESAVRIDVRDGDEGPEITLRDDRAAAGTGGIGEIRTDLALSLSRLALGDAGGRVTVTEDGPGDRRLVIELRGAGSDPESDRQATGSAGDQR
jgi:PAS domain S-box-containing protein